MEQDRKTGDDVCCCARKDRSEERQALYRQGQGQMIRIEDTDIAAGKVLAYGLGMQGQQQGCQV